MSLRTVTISDADLDALVAIRPVVADAHQHPGRAAAIAALDRLASAPDVLEIAQERSSSASPAAESEALASIDDLLAAPPRRPVASRLPPPRLTREAGTAQAMPDAPARARATPAPQHRAQICTLLGFDRVEVLREDLDGRYRVSALCNGRFASEHVLDSELAHCASVGRPATAWVGAFSSLATQLDVPNAEPRLHDVALLLAAQMRAVDP